MDGAVFFVDHYVLWWGGGHWKPHRTRCKHNDEDNDDDVI